MIFLREYFNEGRLYTYNLSLCCEQVRKSSDSTSEITLHAGQARPFSEVDEDEGAERGRKREKCGAEGEKMTVTECGGVVCDGRRGPRDQYVCRGMWTTWVGGGQQPPAADWPAATLTPRPLPHTLS